MVPVLIVAIIKKALLVFHLLRFYKARFLQTLSVLILLELAPHLPVQMTSLHCHLLNNSLKRQAIIIQDTRICPVSVVRKSQILLIKLFSTVASRCSSFREPPIRDQKDTGSQAQRALSCTQPTKNCLFRYKHQWNHSQAASINYTFLYTFSMFCV